jgi:hypothetical protein
MMSKDLSELWALIQADLQRARALLPVRDDDPVIREYHDFLSQNELELACDMLEEYGIGREVEPAFWLALKDAAIKMSLEARASRYQALALPQCPRSRPKGG